MKVLVACSAGAKRSNIMAFLLKGMGHDAIAVGMDMNSTSTIAHLAAWADQIVLTQHLSQWLAKIPEGDRHKVRWDVEVGPDIWAERWPAQLEVICRREAQKFA